MPHFALVTHCSTNYCSREFALPSQPEKAILTIFYITTLNQAKKLTGGSSVLVYWAGGPPASKHQMYLTKPPGCEHFSLIEPRSLAGRLSN